MHWRVHIVLWMFIMKYKAELTSVRFQLYVYLQVQRTKERILCRPKRASSKARMLWSWAPYEGFSLEFFSWKHIFILRATVFKFGFVKVGAKFGSSFDINSVMYWQSIWRVHDRLSETSVSTSAWQNQAPVWAVGRVAAFWGVWSDTLRPLV